MAGAFDAIDRPITISVLWVHQLGPSSKKLDVYFEGGGGKRKGYRRRKERRRSANENAPHIIDPKKTLNT